MDERVVRVGRARVPVRRKLAGLALGTAGSLALFEAVLWAVFFVRAPESRALPELAPRSGERRIVCLGDSNTFGVNLVPELSYPERLQRYLDRAPDNPWRVINLGYPGQNTAQMRARLAENLAAYRPEILVLWGGVNNSWSPAMSYLWEHPDGEPDRPRGLLERSRAYRALRMMVVEGRLTLDARAERRHLKAMERPGDFAVPGVGDVRRGEGLGDVETVDTERDRARRGRDAVSSSIRTDLRRVLAICGEHGVALVLGCYWNDAAWIDGSVNSAIEGFARENGVPLVPLRERMRALVREYGASRLELGDRHASGTGNREVARQVLLTLIDAGLLERRPSWTSVPPVEEQLDAPTLELLGREEGELRVELIGLPDARYLLDVGVVERAEEGEAPVVSRSSRVKGSLSVRGHALLRVPAAGSEGAVAGWRLVARLDGPDLTPEGRRVRRSTAPLLVPADQ